MTYQTHIYLESGIYTTEYKEALPSLGIFKEDDFTRRKSFEEWYFTYPNKKVSVTLTMLFKLAEDFDVEVLSDEIELRAR